MSYAATVRYLYALQYRGIKVGLRNIRALAAFAGHPERSFPVFHVAGTNGKGSTASFLAAILTAAGYRTGLYTSPHLVNFVERIRIDGQPMPETALVKYVRQLHPVIEETGATFFEVTTCVAFQYFADNGVDVAVIETGLGGRLDATNIVIPVVSIITSIGLDHQEILGNTIKRIAREKAGIIKSGAPVVTAATGEALDVIVAMAKRKATMVFMPQGVIRPIPVGGRPGKPKVEIVAARGKGLRTTLGLGGAHQITNASLALSALSLARAKGVFPLVTGDDVVRGLSRVRELSGLRCRLERLSLSWADVVIDVAHNPEGVAVAAAAFAGRGREYFDAVVFGAMKDKDYGGMLDALAGTAKVVIAVRPRTPRAASVRDLLKEGKARNVKIVSGGSVRSGLGLARQISHGRGIHRKSRIFVIGSHYVAGEALRVLEIYS
jgi:dihydrofolate synthase / folylpolyglutamate synthase